MAATRRARPDAVGRGAREQAQRRRASEQPSAEAGQAREVGWAEAQARAWEARWAGFGWRARNEAAAR